MKSKSRTSFLFILSFCLMTLSCCKKPIDIPENTSVMDNLDELGLPPATTSGENTFGCLINGEPWLPLERNVFGTLNYQIDFSMGTSTPGYFTCLMIQSYDSLESFIQFSVLDVFSEGSYTSADFSEGGVFSPDGSLGGNHEIDLTYEESEVMITRLDLEEEIISGTFNLRYTKDSESDTLWVTEGRFDLKGN